MPRWWLGPHSEGQAIGGESATKPARMHIRGVLTFTYFRAENPAQLRSTRQRSLHDVR